MTVLPAGGLPNPVERAVAAVALVVLLPVLAVVAVAVRTESRGPVLFQQWRMGRGGELFPLLKLRTMVVADERPAGAGRITVGADPRITRVGAVLRRCKLDELPQLLNVVRGEMSLVGPRPEVPEYLLPGLVSQQDCLRARPGLTDPAALAYRDEASLLAAAEDPDRYYREVVLPDKTRLSSEYLRHRTWRSDLVVLLRTLAVVVPAPRVQAGRS